MFQNSRRHIAHFDLDAFFISVECLKDSRLKGKPLIVGGSGDRGVVASCSYEARRFGIHSAMPVKLARRLCPEAIIIRGDMESYAKHSGIVTEIIRLQNLQTATPSQATAAQIAALYDKLGFTSMPGK